MRTRNPLFVSAAVLASVLAFGGLAGCAATEDHQSTGAYIDDATITASVKTALLRDDVVKGMDVNVTTYGGVVQLSGFVDSDDQIERAEDIAKSKPGVKSVKNDLRIGAPRN